MNLGKIMACNAFYYIGVAFSIAFYFFKNVSYILLLEFLFANYGVNDSTITFILGLGLVGSVLITCKDCLNFALYFKLRTLSLFGFDKKPNLKVKEIKEEKKENEK